MRSIGIRQLRQEASRYLREVERGESLEVTDRGRPVALLVPTSGADPLERLAVRGRVARGSGDLLELGAPLAPRRGVPLPTELLDHARADER